MQLPALRHPDQVIEELHDGRVRLLVIERAREQRALYYVRQGGALQERDRRPLDEPRAQPEEIVDRIRMVPQAVLLLQQLKRRVNKSLKRRGYSPRVGNKTRRLLATYPRAPERRRARRRTHPPGCCPDTGNTSACAACKAA